MAEKGTYTYDYPRPAFCVDSVVFRVTGSDLKTMEVLLIERGEEPFLGKLALPGGHVEMEEDLHEACSRELQEETSLVVPETSWREIGTYGTPGRDPRGRVISTAFWTLLGRKCRQGVRPGSDARVAEWKAVPVLEDLAFDHEKILFKALWDLQEMSQNSDLVFRKVLPEKFTMRDLQTAQETLQRQKFDKRNFQAQVKKHPCVQMVPEEFRSDAKSRPAQLYTHSKLCCIKHNLG